MSMSQEHKDALARGRRESRGIRMYLEALSDQKPSRDTEESLDARIARIEASLESEENPLKRVDLLQKRLDAVEARKRLSATADMASLEDGFVEAVKGYSERKGITYAAWREAGVPAAVLRRAGVSRGA